MTLRSYQILKKKKKLLKLDFGVVEAVSLQNYCRYLVILFVSLPLDAIAFIIIIIRYPTKKEKKNELNFTFTVRA